MPKVRQKNKTQFCRTIGALIFINIVLQEFFFLKTPRGDVSTGMLQSQGCFFKILKFLAKAQSNSLHCSALEFSPALGIGAASFWSEAEKDIAESPTASPERPKERQRDTKKGLPIIMSSPYACSLVVLLTCSL